MSQSTSESSSRPCGDDCGWEYNLDVDDWVIVHGCSDPYKYCSKPPVLAIRAAKRMPHCTECVTEDFIMDEVRDSKGSDSRRVIVEMPHLEDPDRYLRVFDTLHIGETGRITSLRWGWFVCLRHKGAAIGKAASIKGETSTQVDDVDSLGRFAVKLRLQEDSELTPVSIWVTQARPWGTAETRDWEVMATQLKVLRATAQK